MLRLGTDRKLDDLPTTCTYCLQDFLALIDSIFDITIKFGTDSCPVFAAILAVDKDTFFFREDEGGQISLPQILA